MCLPAAIAKVAGVELTGAALAMANMQFAMSALTIGAQYMGQKEQAEATYQWQEEQAKATQKVAADSARHQYMGLIMRGEQARAAAAQDIQGALGQTVEASARARVASAAGGVTGTSVDEASSNFAMQYEDFASNRMTNLSWEEDQIAMSMEGVRAQQEGRNQASIGDPIAMPSPFGALAQMGSSAFDAAGFWGTQV
ncbi:MAG: hypothetical protein Unbinned5784contig1000_31 [Prokaryotic dsDNA virus sp.]|nr:MAG: hypothetical protein Unbinned5784contig1000_31 [Prokaryotic dsDNA virus sp.]|tara:strand:+ start:3295 stop:3885 length:591 start_codon:yes stop_codon:yes gene_type:complete